MRLYEKILIGIFLLLLGIRPFLSGDVAFGLFCLFVSFWTISYLIGGYWLLNPKKNKSYFIPIVAGIIFATSLFTLPYTLNIKRENIFINILPLFNIGFFVALGIYLFLKRKAEDKNPFFKKIFIRSLVILIVICFFSYTPASFKPYRYVLTALNYGDKYLVSNMQMFDYKAKFDKAIKNGDCERAIEFAEKANEAGLIWLEIPLEEIDNVSKNHDEIWKISGTFDILYEAYKCKANQYYQKSNYEQALTYYTKAAKALNACEYNLELRKIEEAYSLQRTARCYIKLCNYEYADSLLVKAIEKYQAVKGNIEDENVAYIYSDLAESKAKQMQFGYSKQLYEAAIAILQKDSTKNNEKQIIENYYNIIINN